MEILIATNNKHKILEIKHILKNKNIKILSPDELNLKNIKPKENGKTYFENALKKAKTFARISNLPVLADDSGLEIDFLKGAPGIYSSRFLRRGTARRAPTFHKKNITILKMMKDIPKKERRAKFVCHCVLITPDGKIFDARGECNGFIHNKIAGKNGFGYDPIFYIPRFKKTMAQLPEKVKNKISHRAKAFKKIEKHLKK